MKVFNSITTGVLGPVQEEIFFRYLVQDVLFTKIPKYIVKKITPGRETTFFDSSTAKAIRITLTAAAFSAIHLFNKGEPPSIIKIQVVSTFAMGIGFGIVKESKAGLLGSIGAHMAFNFVALMPELLSC